VVKFVGDGENVCFSS